jgi:hypothetical protein
LSSSFWNWGKADVVAYLTDVKSTTMLQIVEDSRWISGSRNLSPVARATLLSRSWSRGISEPVAAVAALIKSKSFKILRIVEDSFGPSVAAVHLQLLINAYK